MLAISLPQLCWGRWREAPDGVWPAASTQVGLHDHRCERASIQTCFPHPIRPFGPPSPLRGEGAARRDRRRPVIDWLKAISRERNANSRTARRAAAGGGAHSRILDFAFLSRPAPPSKQ
jgi:hypothetical protein